MSFGQTALCTQFLLAVSHSIGAHTEALQPTEVSSSSSEDEDNQALVPTAKSAASKSAAADTAAHITAVKDVS